MKNLILTIKGFFIGIANIIPGVSGGTLMISLGIYEDMIEAISHFFSNVKKHLKLVFFIGIGALLSVVLLSNVVTYSLDNFKLPTIIFFIGLILGGIPMLFKKVKGNISLSNILLFIITFSLIIIMTITKNGLSEISLVNMNLTSYLLLFLVGIVAAASMVVPGISGSFILIFLGYYEPILNIIKEFTQFNNLINNGIVLGVFGLGVLIGIVLVAKLIEFLIKKYEIKTYSAILGFVTSSVISIFITSYNELVFNTGLILSAIVLGIIGFIIAYKLGE